MGMTSRRMLRVGAHGRFTVGGLTLLVISCLAMEDGLSGATADEPAQSSPGASSFHFPTVRSEHRHARELLANALRYIAQENRLFDPASGYPFEGWNQDPARGLHMRSFTQLTAIGHGLEVLANVAAGTAETPYLSRDQALATLSRMVKNLRKDQQDPWLSATSLLGNFLDLALVDRRGPLAYEVEKDRIIEGFGPDKGEALWKALVAKGWILPRRNGREADLHRTAEYGWDHFDGPLAPFRDEATKQKVLDILDRRVVMVVFVDNANLSSAVAKAIGALLGPGIKNRPGVAELRQELERFLDAQREGYSRLYDAAAGQFYFGWDATKNRLFGWEDPHGQWVTGHVDYLVNEFRGPATFIVTRFGLPLDAIRNLGFKMKPYRLRQGREVTVLAPWEGSAFQALGFEVSMTERDSPSWRRLLEAVVDVEIDYSTRRKLPGFLSEAYTGVGDEYTGRIGIPEITVATRPRITDAASLYSLGAAYSVAPEPVERFLAENWPVISRMLTDHGPWEGFNTTRQQVIQFQTSAHTFSLILGLLGTSSDHMKRYLDSKGLSAKLEDVFRPGEAVDLFSPRAQVFAWDDKGVSIQSKRGDGTFHVKADRISNPGIAFVSTSPDGLNLSGGLLSLRYRSAVPMDQAIITLKPVGNPSIVARLIPTEIFTHFADTRGDEQEIQVPLPATPGLARTKEVVITFGPGSKGRPIDLAITGLRITPIAAAEAPQTQGPAGRQAGP